MNRHFEESGRAMRGFYRTLNEVFNGFETIEEIPGGYTLTFPAAGGWEDRVDRFRQEFEQRFPAYRIVVVRQPDGGSRVELSGPEGSREFVERTIVAAQSGNLKFPSPLRMRLSGAYRRATSALRMLPSFLIIGAPRSGTTSLHAYLCQHPLVLSAVRKELGFFDIFYERGLGHYRSLFPFSRGAPGGGGGKPITGEATPTYLAHPAVPQRVRQALPAVKLIAMVRNPVERAFSQYHWSVRNGVEPLPFAEAIEREDERLAGEAERMATKQGHFSFEWVYHSYLSTGLYADHLERWMAAFPRKQLLVVGMEAFAADPQNEFRRILEFLDLPAFEPTGFERMNAFPYPDLDPAIRSRLAEHFRPHNERLWGLLGTDLGWNQVEATPCGGDA